MPNRAVSHKIPKKKSAVGMVLDESNLSLYRSVSKEMKTGLRVSTHLITVTGVCIQKVVCSICVAFYVMLFPKL